MVGDSCLSSADPCSAHLIVKRRQWVKIGEVSDFCDSRTVGHTTTNDDILLLALLARPDVRGDVP